MNTVTTTLQQEDAAYVVIANSLMNQIQNLESGPEDEYDTGWSDLLARKMAQYSAICEFGRDLSAMMDQEDRYKDEMEPEDEVINRAILRDENSWLANF